MMIATDEQSKIQDLKASLKGKLFTAEDEGFSEAAAIWNKAAKQQPQIVVLAENKNDIIEVLKFAREQEMPLSVKSGGHDWAGRAIAAGGIQINMRRMNRVTVNPTEKTAVVQGGALSIEVIRAAEPHNLLAVTGGHDDVGFTGLSLGGGYSILSPSLGLAIDNVIGAEIILDDGTICQVDAQNYPDLFWAIRGGGGNFGVITFLKIRLHESKPLLEGNIIFKGSDAMQVLKGLNEIVIDAPDQLNVYTGIMIGPDGKPVVSLMPVWFGDQSPESEKYMEALNQLATPVQAEFSVRTYSEHISGISDMFRKMFGIETNYAEQTRWLTSLNSNVINEIVSAVNNLSSPYSAINILFINGKATKVAADETPFPMRKPHYLIFTNTHCPSGDKNIQQYKQWAAELLTALDPWAYPGGYANVLGPDDKDQIADAFGDNRERLQKIKKKYDPDNVFKGIGNLN